MQRVEQVFHCINENFWRCNGMDLVWWLFTWTDIVAASDISTLGCIASQLGNTTATGLQNRADLDRVKGLIVSWSTNARYRAWLYSAVFFIIYRTWMWSMIPYLLRKPACSGVWKSSSLHAGRSMMTLENSLQTFRKEMGRLFFIMILSPFLKNRATTFLLYASGVLS